MRCGGFFSTIQLSNISSDLRYKNHHKINRSIGQSTLTKRSSYFHIRWLRHFPKVKHYPLSGLASEESTHGNAVHNQSQAPPLQTTQAANRRMLRINASTSIKNAHKRHTSHKTQFSHQPTNNHPQPLYRQADGHITHVKTRTRKSPRPVCDASANALRGRQDAAAGCYARSFGCAYLPSWRCQSCT